MTTAPAFSAHKEAIQRLMESLDENAEKIGSGPYAAMAKDLQHLYSLEEHRTHWNLEAFGLTMACEHPMGLNSTKLIGLFKNDMWVRKVVIAKKLEHEHLVSQGQPRLATIVTKQWMRAFAQAAIDKQSLVVATGMCKIRWGIRALFVMRVGMLPYVVETLNALGLKPKQLFAQSFGLEPPDEDPGLGPTAEQLLLLEPRFIRWLLGYKESYEWPKDHVWLNNRFTDYELSLLEDAEDAGGDSILVNSPCACPSCGNTNFRFMPLTKAQSAHEYAVGDAIAFDWFPPSITAHFNESEKCNIHTWFERRFMRDHCKDPTNPDRPKWHLSAKALEFFQRSGITYFYREAEPHAPRPMAGNYMHDAEFMKLLEEAQKAGYAEAIGDRVRVLSRKCKRKRFDISYAP